MNKIRAFIWGIMGVSLLLAGCTKDLSKEDKIAPLDFFDFHTANTQVINVEYKVPVGYVVAFEAYVEYPVDTLTGVKKELTPLFSGFTDENGKYSSTVQVPTYVNAIYLFSNNIGVPNVTRMSLEGARSRSVSRADDTNYEYSTCLKGNCKVMGESGKWNAIGRPNYLGTTKEVSKDGLDMLNATLGNDDKHTNDYIAKSGEANLNVVKDGATIDVVVVYNGGNTRSNTIGYYYYETGTMPSADVQKIILLPNATFAPNGGLVRGDNVRLKYWDEDRNVWSESFPKGLTVGWFIMVGGYSTKTHDVDNTRGINGFSNTELNAIVEKQHNVIVRDPNTGIRYIGFEDQNFGIAPSYRDFIFYVDAKADEVEFNDKDIPDGKDMTDTDNDGIPDVDDKFPNDASRADSINYIGSVAFEDIWPYKGDYDMNDVSLSYKTTHYINKVSDVTRIIDRWTVNNVGAQLENGFGYQYNMKNFKVTTGVGKLIVTSNHPKSSFVETINSIEKGQTEATIILFDNAREVMSAPKETRTFTVDLTLAGPTRVNEIGFPPYNPFMLVDTKNNGRGHEVHLPNYAPTALMDMKLLHFGHDLSVPEKKIYYISDNNLPFAIHVIGVDLIASVENQKISVIYPEFSKWVSSNGVENKDWYLHPAK